MPAKKWFPATVARWCRTLTTLMHDISPRVRNCITDGTMWPQFCFRNSRKWARDHFAGFLARSMSMKVLVQDRLCCHTVAPRAVFSITSGLCKPPMPSAESAKTADGTWVCVWGRWWRRRHINTGPLHMKKMIWYRTRYIFGQYTHRPCAALRPK